MVSPAEGLLMMQGGTDRTGLAGLLDSIGTPGADMMAQRRAEAAEQAAMDEYERRQAEDMAELASLFGAGDDPEENIQEGDDLNIMQSLFGDEEGNLTSDAAMGQNAMLAASLGAAVPAGIAGSKVAKAIMPDSPGFFKSDAYVFKRKLPGMLTRRAALAGTGVGLIPAAASLIPEVGYEVARAMYPEQIGAFEEKVGSGIRSGAETVGSGLQSGVDYLRDLTGMDDVEPIEDRTDEEIARDNEIASQYFMNPYQDGGRVGMFLGGSSGTVSPNLGAQALNQSGLGGGLMSLISQNPLYQSMIEQYRQPTFDFSQVASPSIPQPSVAPATPPQAYTPFVSTMPLYDPSTLGTGLPSTAGMADPFFVYDPNSPVGAFDAPPARTGPTPLTQDKIMETFKNIDKFDLAKQEAKRKAAEAAAKAKTQPKKGGGGGKEKHGQFMAGKNKAKNKSAKHAGLKN